MNRVKLDIGICRVWQEEQVSVSMDHQQKQKVEKALSEILQSSGFSNSSQMGNFLEYIVTTTLEGRASDIKGYTIGIDALGKDESFDPTTDPSVRVMAGRLRQALANFYLETPDHVGPKIELPKGKYVPVFDWAKKTDNPTPTSLSVEDEVSAPRVPTKSQAEPLQFYSALALSILALGVGLYSVFITKFSNRAGSELPLAVSLYAEHAKLPLVQLDISHSENGLPDWIPQQLVESQAIVSFSRFNEYRFKSSPVNSDRSPPADYVIEILFSTVTGTQDLDAYITIKRGNTGEIIWSERNQFPESADASEEENRMRVGKLVSRIMAPYGIIHSDITIRDNPPPRLACIRSIYEYFQFEKLQTFSNGIACAEEAINSGTASSSMHAMMTFLQVEAFRRDIATGWNDPLLLARKYADEAVRLDGTNARAYQARFAVEKASGNKNLAITLAETAIRQNPFDRDIIGDFAAYLVSIEELERARKPLKLAIELSPRPPAWLTFYNYLLAELTGELKLADEVAAQITLNESPLLATALLLSAERNGDAEKITSAIGVLEKSEPGFLENPEAEFLRRGFSTKLAAKLSTRLKNVTSGM